MKKALFALLGTAVFFGASVSSAFATLDCKEWTAGSPSTISAVLNYSTNKEQYRYLGCSQSNTNCKNEVVGQGTNGYSCTDMGIIGNYRIWDCTQIMIGRYVTASLGYHQHYMSQDASTWTTCNSPGYWDPGNTPPLPSGSPAVTHVYCDNVASGSAESSSSACIIASTTNTVYEDYVNYAFYGLILLVAGFFLGYKIVENL